MTYSSENNNQISHLIYQEASMSDLTPQHYELVLKYMETTNEDNFDTASLALQQHDFNLERAIQNKFNHPPPRERVHHHHGPSDQEIIRKYVQFVTKKNQQWSLLSSIFGGLKTILFTVLGIFSLVLPSTLRIRYFGSDFQRLYVGRLPTLFTSRSLPSLLKQTRNNSSKSVLVLVSPLKSHPDISDFLSKPDLQKLLGRNFWLTGHSANHPQLAKIERPLDVPVLISLRENIFEQLVEVGRTKELGAVDSALLDRWTHEGRNLFKRDCNVLIKYRNFVSRAFGHFYEEEEEEEVNLADFERNTQQIQQQNQAYQRVEEETRRMKQMEEEKEVKQKEELKKKEELQAQRELRKASLPPEPEEGNIIRFSFRCPDGSTIVRNFHAEESLDLVFQWVELNDQIQFEDSKREFQIMHSYPPEPLSSRKSEILSSIFDSPQEKLVIREL